MDILKQFPTRSSLVSHLQTIKEQGREDFDSYEHDLWVKWARVRRPQRMVTILQILLAVAEHTTTTTYGDIGKAIYLGSNNELMQLITHIASFCKMNGFPPYVVLIKNQNTKKVGAGFFKFYDPDGKKTQTQEQMDQFEREMEVRCFTEEMPDQLKVQTRLAEYIHSHLT